MKMIFSETSGLNDSIYGNVQAPVRMLLEQRGEEYEQNSLLPMLFNMGTSENFGDLYTSMTAMDGFSPVGENGAYPKDGMMEGYQKMLRYTTWKDSFAISQEMIEDAKMMDLRKQPTAFMQSYGRTRENFGAALFAGAMMGKTDVDFRGKKFDITSADGKSLFHTAHKPFVKGSNQSNKFSNAFSVDALGQMESAMHLFKGDDDQILDVAPDTILIPESATMLKEVLAAVGADKDPNTDRNGFNYHFGRWNIICWPYLNNFLTGTDRPWVLLDSKYNQTYQGAIWNDRIALTVKSYVDEETDANIWKGRARFNATFNDWRFAAVGGVTGGVDLATLNL